MDDTRLARTVETVLVQYFVLLHRRREMFGAPLCFHHHAQITSNALKELLLLHTRM